MAADAEQIESAGPKAKVFISYSRKDMGFVDLLEAALKTRGFEPLIDRTEIYAFEDWWKRLEALIGRADSVVCVLSPDAVASREVQKEIEYAASLNKRFAPIVYRRVDDNATPEALRRLNFVFFDDQAQFEASADKLANGLNTDVGWVRKHTEYGEAGRQWAGQGRPGGLLLRSPALEDAERWIASRPHGAPEPTAETQAFVTGSRSGATRRRNILTGSLAAGLLVALALAGVAYWQRGIAVEERQIAEQQRQRAEDTLAAATQTANRLVFDLAQRFRNVVGMPSAVVKDILERARALQDQLNKSGQTTPDLKRSEAGAILETGISLQAIGDTTGARAADERALHIIEELLAGNPGSTSLQLDLSVMTGDVGNVQLVQGDLAGALKSFRDALAITDRLAKSDPGNAKFQLDLSMSFNNVGIVQAAQNDLAGALKSFREGLEIVDRLTKSDPDNTGWYASLSDSYNHVGDVQVAQGDLAGASQSYRNALAMRERLAKSFPAHAGWQRDLSVSFNNVGNVQVAQGDLAGALKSYRDGLEIVDRLTKSDPDNTGWQAGLSESYIDVGDVQEAQGDLADALKSFRGALAVRERLAKSDPGNAGWENSVSVSLDRVGDVLLAQGDLAGAGKSYRDGLAIRERSVKIDPNNAGWQRDLHVSFGKVGDVLVRQSNFAAALSSYREGLEIIDRLAKSDPDNAGWQRDLSVSFSLMGTAQAAKGDLADALKSFRDCVAIGERLTKSDPNNTGWQSELSNSYNNIGTVLQLQGNPASALTFYRNGLAISQRLAALDPTNTRWRYNEEFFIRKIGRSSYSLVLAHDYANALAAVDQAISLAGEQTWLDANRAHALMFLGRIDEARDLYLKYRGRQIPEAKGNTWEAVVLGDFAEFRKAGLSSSLMDEVDKKFQLASIRAN